MAMTLHGGSIAFAHGNVGRGGLGMDADDKATLQAMGSSLAWAIIIALVVAAIAFQLLVYA